MVLRRVAALRANPSVYSTSGKNHILALPKYLDLRGSAWGEIQLGIPCTTALLPISMVTKIVPWELPDCGECWTNWARTITNLKKTKKLTKGGMRRKAKARGRKSAGSSLREMCCRHWRQLPLDQTPSGISRAASWSSLLQSVLSVPEHRTIEEKTICDRGDYYNENAIILWTTCHGYTKNWKLSTFSQF